MKLRKSDARDSVAHYLEGEKDGLVRHELVDGHIYAVGGASDRHNRISLNIAGRLDNHLSTGGVCETFMSDMKVRVDERTYYYPDIVVSCEEHPSDSYFRSEAVVIVEVTSRATHRIDHNEKRLGYRRIATLKEYVLVSQDQIRVETHRRSGDDWVEQILISLEDKLDLQSVGLSIKLADIYRRVRFDEPGE